MPPAGSKNRPIKLPELGHVNNFGAWQIMADEEPGIEIGAHSDQNGEKKSDPSSCVQKFTALVLIILGAILYIYTLYIVISRLVYPGSISPLVSVFPHDKNATSGKYASRSYFC